MHRINTSHCGKQALAQLKHQLNWDPVSKQPNQKLMRHCTGLHPRKRQRPTGQQQTKGGFVHLRAEDGPLAKRSHQEDREQLLS